MIVSKDMLIYKQNRSIAETVEICLLTAMPQVRLQVASCEVRSELNGNSAGISSSFFGAPLLINIPLWLQTHLLPLFLKRSLLTQNKEVNFINIPSIYELN